MNEIDERAMQITEDKHGRRSFLKRILKYLVGFGAFGIASLAGLKRNGEIRLGKMKNIEFGLSEAQGACGFAANCAGGGGKCGFAANCAGDGGSGGGGQCGFAANCAGGGGKCGFAANCAGS